MNRWTGMGRLVRDPEVKITEKSGKCFARFVLAINYQVNGEDRAEFIPCECWEKTAEIIGEFYGKGDKVLVTGRLRTRKYQKDDENRFFTYVNVNQVETAEKKNKQKKTPASEQQPTPEITAGSVDEWPPVTPDDIDVPF